MERQFTIRIFSCPECSWILLRSLAFYALVTLLPLCINLICLHHCNPMSSWQWTRFQHLLEASPILSWSWTITYDLFHWEEEYKFFFQVFSWELHQDPKACWWQQVQIPIDPSYQHHPFALITQFWLFELIHVHFMIFWWQLRRSRQKISH